MLLRLNKGPKRQSQDFILPEALSQMFVLPSGGVVYEVAEASSGRPVALDREARPGEKVYIKVDLDANLQGIVNVSIVFSCM